MVRGTLRIYLGAAPGVGKTYAMLDEGWRRRQRGTDVVVGVVETHGRAATAAQIRDLEVVPRREVAYRGTVLAEMDLDAVLARRPQVVLVDELAHTNAPGLHHAKRWQDVEALLDAGIDVISTVNVQHLESLNDVVAKITGIQQQETVPDAFVRAADQIELVDMTPEALRRRLAHGNVYPADRIDAALANYFRPGNLGALRELALLWVADRVQDSLDHYLADHGIAGTWETRERVVVTVSGSPAGEALIRRAARMAARSRGDLVAVRVVPADGLSVQGDPELVAGLRALVGELGGSYHEVVGDDVAASLVEFARAERATQLVVGTSGRTRWQRLVRGSVVNDVIERVDGIDVHVIAGAERTAPARRVGRRSALPARRRLTAWAVLAVLGPLLSLVLVAHRDGLSLTTVTELALAFVVIVAGIGGLAPGIVASLAASFVINWFFTPPFGTLTISEPQNAVSLVVYVAVAAAVSVLVDRVARQSHSAQRARAEAEALAWSTSELVGSSDPLPALLEHLRSTFRQSAVAVLTREAGHWVVVSAAGTPVPTAPREGDSVPLGEGAEWLVWDGPALAADERRVVRVLANQIAVALDARRAAEQAQRTHLMAEADAVRAALLQSVSHDLRTPLATIKAYVSGLRQHDVTWSAADVDDALAAVEGECDRLNRLVGNLLDASRLQAGALAVARRATAVDEIVAEALGGTAPDAVRLVVDGDLPLVDTDPVLIERAVANIVENALRYSPAGSTVEVEAREVAGAVHLRVIDHGPGIDRPDRERVFQPFQRLGDTNVTPGVGLGMAIARGFVEAVGAELDLDDTPGGGLTVTMRLPVAAVDQREGT